MAAKNTILKVPDADLHDLIPALRAMLAEIWAREAKATKGPWDVVYSHDRQDGNDLRPMPYIQEVRRGGRIARMWVRRLSHEPNAVFIANARQDIPWLLDTVEMLLQLLQTQEQACMGVKTLREEED